MASTSPKPFVFVLMPFDKTFGDVYALGIKAACKEAGAYCERVDEQYFTESILDRIYMQISKADVIVSDMTGRNPNVFYETGYAHALGKRTILLTKNADDIPFDLKHYPHIVYGESISSLKDDLKKRVRYFLDHPEKMQQVGSDDLEYYVEGTRIFGNSVISIFKEIFSNFGSAEINFAKAHGQIEFSINIGIFNPGSAPIDTFTMQFGLVIPPDLRIAVNREFVRLPDQKIMMIFQGPQMILPQGWHHILVNFRSNDIKSAFPYWCAVRCFTELGMREIPFVLSFPGPVLEEGGSTAGN